MATNKNPVLERLVTDLLAVYNRVILKITIPNPADVPESFRKLPPVDNPNKTIAGPASSNTHLVEKDKYNRCFIDASTFMEVLGGHIYRFKDVTLSCKEMAPHGTVIRCSCRMEDPQNPVKANFQLSDPRFLQIMSQLQLLNGTLMVYEAADPYAKQKGEKIMTIELRQAKMDPIDKPTYVRKIELTNLGGLQIMRYPQGSAVPLKPLIVADTVASSTVDDMLK